MSRRAQARTRDPRPDFRLFSQRASGALCGMLLGAIACGGASAPRGMPPAAEGGEQSDPPASDASELQPSDASDPKPVQGAVPPDTTRATGSAADLPDPAPANASQTPSAAEPSTAPSALEALLLTYRSWQPSTAAPIGVSDSIFAL